MATIEFHGCLITGDMADAVIQFEQEMTAATLAITDTMRGLDLTEANQAMAAAKQGLNDILQLTPFGDINTLADKTCAPKFQGDPVADRIFDEKRLQFVGLSMINGVAFVAGSDGNIEAIRRLYFACGSNLDRVDEILSGKQAAGVATTVVGKVNTVKVNNLVPGNSPSLAEIHRILGRNDVLETDLIVAKDFTLVKTRSFGGIDVNPATLGILEADAYYSVFYFNQIDQSGINIARFTNVIGLSGNKLTSALFGTPLQELESKTITSTGTDIENNLNQTNVQLKFILEHPSLPNVDRKIIIDNEIARLDRLNVLLQSLRVVPNFEVVVIPDRTVLTSLRSRGLKLADIKELLEVRTDITSISFGADVGQKMLDLSNQLPGSTIFSTICINQHQEQMVDTLDDQIERKQIQISRTHDALKVATTNPSISNTASAVTANKPEAVPVAAVIAPAGGFDGFISHDSPAVIIMNRVDWEKTSNFDLFAFLGLSKVFKEFAAVIDAVGRIFESANKIIDDLFNKILDILSPVLKLLEEIQSAQFNLMGSGNFDAGILKCSLGGGIGLGLGKIFDLREILDALRKKLKNILAAISNALTDLLEKVLCKPLGMLNSLLQPLNALPFPCKIAGFGLPDVISDAINKMRKQSLTQAAIISAAKRNILEINTSLIIGPSNVDNFIIGAKCPGDSSLNFLNSSQRAVNFGKDFPNPFTSLTAPLGNLGGGIL